MADEKADKNPKTLKQDRLVEQLVPDPGTHEPSIQLRGWLGKGAKEGTWRLYLTPQMDQYVQFSNSDIVHTQPVEGDQSSLGGTMVWLKAGTPLRHTRVVTRQLQADFLSGGITSKLMAGTAPSFGAASARARPGTLGYVCSVNPHIPACRPPTDACSVGCSADYGCTGALCPTAEFVCGQSAGCTWGGECSVDCAGI